jgi:catechol 2,3-dioxygenase
MTFKNGSFIINPSIKIDHVHLKVLNLKKSINFYQSIFGFKVLEKRSNQKTALLSLATEDKDTSSLLLVLTEVKDKNTISSFREIKKESGLYHFAILLPEIKYLSAFLRYIQNNLESQYYEGMADHSVSESIYIHDLDFNGIEVYRDRPPSEWKWIGNKVHMITEPLNVTYLLNKNVKETWNGLPSGTTIGHVHLHVSNLVRSKRFYHDILGLHHTASYPGALFFAANSYHHHIATNTWIGTNILSANNNHYKPGLDHYAIILPNREEMDRLKNRFMESKISIDETLEESDKQYHHSLYIYDPDGIKIQFLCK